MHSASPARALAVASALAVTALIARPALAQTTPPASSSATKPATMDHGAMGHGAMDHGAMNHGAMDHGAMSHDSGWAAMDEFHMLLMKTWHPASATNDLAPTRENAAAMATKAEAWAKSPVPATCGGTTSATVALIATDSRALAGLVASKAADAQVKESLSALHDRFESVEKGCAAAAPAATHTMPAKPPAVR